MQFVFEISDDSPEAEELLHVVATINKQHKRDAKAAGKPEPDDVTPQSYLAPIVIAHLRKRVQNIYLQHAKTLSATQLKNSFGPLETVRGNN